MKVLLMVFVLFRDVTYFLLVGSMLRLTATIQPVRRVMKFSLGARRGRRTISRFRLSV